MTSLHRQLLSATRTEARQNNQNVQLYGEARCKSTLTPKATLLITMGHRCTKCHGNTISRFHLITHYVSGRGDFSQGFIFCIHTLASKIDNESDAAGNLNCGNSARKRRSTSKLLPGCHARHCCSLVLMITVLVKDE